MIKIKVNRKRQGNQELLILDNFTNVFTSNRNGGIYNYAILFNTAYDPDGEVNTQITFSDKDKRDMYFENILSATDSTVVIIDEE